MPTPRSPRPAPRSTRWANATPSARSQALLDLATAVESHFEQMVAMECVDAGKPVTAVRDDELPGRVSMPCVTSPARVAHCPRRQVATTSKASRRRCAANRWASSSAITPWNYPLLQAVAKIFPALAVGNTVVIKPAETTPYSTALLVQLAGEILPPGVLNLVFGTGAVAGMRSSRPPRRRRRVVHRFHRHRTQGRHGRRRRCQEGDHGTRRQLAGAGVRRRRPAERRWTPSPRVVFTTPGRSACRRPGSSSRKPSSTMSSPASRQRCEQVCRR